MLVDVSYLLNVSGTGRLFFSGGIQRRCRIVPTENDKILSR